MSLSKVQVGILLFLTAVLMVFLHKPVLDQPPGSVHRWRQCHTLAVAQNFYSEEMNILRPRIDRRGNTNGITGMQFPAYEFGLALLYRVLGPEMWVHRWYSLVLTFLALLALYRICILIWNDRLLAVAVAFMLPWSPDLFYHSSNALPDVLSLCAGLWGFAMALTWRLRKVKRHFWAAILFFILSGLTKIQYLSIAIPLGVLLIQDFRKHEITRNQLSAWISGSFLGSVLVIGWYLYAGALRKSSGLTDFGLHFNPVTNWSEALSILWGNATSQIPESLLNYACFVLVLLGLVLGLKKRKNSEWILPFVVWIGVLFLYHLIELGQMKDHIYYMYPYLLPMWLMAGYAIRHLFAKRRWRIVALALLVVQPALAFLRMSHRWKSGQEFIPSALYQSGTRQQLRSVQAKGIPIVGPDHSGSIYFFYLDLAGFGFGDPEDLFRTTNGRKNLDIWIELGAGSLYTDNTTLQRDPRFTPYIASTVQCIDGFCVYELKTP